MYNIYLIVARPSFLDANTLVYEELCMYMYMYNIYVLYVILYYIIYYACTYTYIVLPRLKYWHPGMKA